MGTIHPLPRPAWRAAALAALAACALAALLMASAPSALAREVGLPTLPDGTVMTVSDDITRIHVDKVDARTHDAVKGARMQIVVEGTGEVVDEWVTDGATHMFEKGLDVNVRYILREAEAPEGYAKIDDTVFQANEMEGTGITLLAQSDSVELVDAYKVAVYEPHDEAVAVEERIAYARGTAATGDGAPIAAFAAIAGAALAIALAALAALRRERGE